MAIITARGSSIPLITRNSSVLSSIAESEPSRYYITDDERLVLSSEVGVLDIPAEHILKKERLHPGKMLLVDTVNGQVLNDKEKKNIMRKKSLTESGWTAILQL